MDFAGNQEMITYEWEFDSVAIFWNVRWRYKNETILEPMNGKFELIPTL